MDSDPRLISYIGQEQTKKNISVILESKKNCGPYDPPIDHILLTGGAGLGKTLLAETIANEVGRPLIKLMGPHVDLDSLSVLENTKSWTFLFIDEIHSLAPKVEEALYEPMDTFKWKDRPINSFTLIGATTKEGAIQKPLLSRFTIVERLQPYNNEEIEQIVAQKASRLGVSIDVDATKLIAARSKGVPRQATTLLKRTAYYSRDISLLIAQNCLDSLRIDEHSLDDMDRRILKTVQKNFGGGPVGIEALAAVMGEDVEKRRAFIQRNAKDVRFLDI